MYLVFDTETTGLPRNFDAPISDSDNWPRMVQIAWQLHDENGNLVWTITKAGGTVTINPFESTEDERAIAAAEQNSITVYGNQSKDRADEITEELQDVIVHEAAHIFDGSGTKRISVSDDWKSAINEDGTLTAYSGINQDKPQEDFAEAVKLFVNYNNELKEKSPNRYNILTNIFSKK